MNIILKDNMLKPDKIANWTELPRMGQEIFTTLSNKHIIGDDGDLLIYRNHQFIARADFEEVSGMGHVIITYLYDKYNNKEIYDRNE